MTEFLLDDEEYAGLFGYLLEESEKYNFDQFLRKHLECFISVLNIFTDQNIPENSRKYEAATIFYEVLFNFVSKHYPSIDIDFFEDIIRDKFMQILYRNGDQELLELLNPELKRLFNEYVNSL